ncbi:hypothetical protein FF36_04726 [Frankia torreyi]|uniref:DUF5667 domain-containing protein n=1 Tax=Frankia torreyi TaxID=1856 RepID=A0A0D8B9U1_9ACTN|nr:MULTISPECIES: DUF5667 domain-containing protein [Frankia]KJE20951.1 hypothetical protein FF36_04726 [Frankia torreyi]KQM03821.1 hypothetical protein FF86_103438 [Frankia sp. CpI1-P]
MRAARGRDRDSAGVEQPGPGSCGSRWWRLRRTRAERAAALLEGRRPPTDASDIRLANAAAALRDLPIPRMNPVRRDAVRSHLLASLTDQTSTAARGSGNTGRRVRPAPARRGRVLRAARPLLAVSLAGAVALAGLAVSAQDALPGETLYSVKRRVENLQVSLVRDPVARAKTRLDVAGTRMNELRTITLGEGAPIGRANTDTGSAANIGTGGTGGTGGTEAAAEVRPPAPTALGQPAAAGIPPLIAPVAGAAGGLAAVPEASSRAETGVGTPSSTLRTSAAAAGPAGAADQPSGPADPSHLGDPLGSPRTAGTGLPLLPARPLPPVVPAAAPGTAAASATAAAPTASAPAPASLGRHADAGMVNSLLRAWCAQARAGSRVLLARATAGNADAWATMNAFTTEQSDRLTPVLAALPPGTTDATRAALDLIDGFRRALGPRLPRPTAATAAHPASAAPTAAPTTASQGLPPTAMPSTPVSPSDTDPITAPTSASSPISGPAQEATHGSTGVDRAAEPVAPDPTPAAPGQPNAVAPAVPPDASSTTSAAGAPRTPDALAPAGTAGRPAAIPSQAGSTNRAGSNSQPGTGDRAGTAGTATATGGAGAPTPVLGADGARVGALPSGVTSSGAGGEPAGDGGGTTGAANGTAPAAGTPTTGTPTGAATDYGLAPAG